jgi:flagellar biosynthesis protein FlhB
MADQRPSPRKLESARARGDVPHSALIETAFALTGFALALGMLGPALVRAWSALWAACVSGVRGSGVHSIAPAGYELLAVAAPLCVVPGLAALLASLLQSGWVRARSEAGCSARAFSWLSGEQLRESALSVIFGGVLVLAWAHVLAPSLAGVLDLWQRSPSSIGAAAFELSRVLLAQAASVLVVLGAAHFVWRSVLRRRRLRMTRQELEDERRADAGDPALLAERRRRMRAHAQEASLAELPRACLVVHDGVHAAIALRYVATEHTAPVVWIKGRGELAMRLTQAARSAGVPAHRDPGLVMALSPCELTEAIPSALHERVAKLMAAGARCAR